MKIKVCGMRDPENIRQVAQLQPDYMGFIFYQGSKRYATNSISPELLAELPPSIKKVGVFVNASEEYMQETVNKYKLDAVQLHGRETPKVCATMQGNGIEVIKVFSVDDKFVFENALLYETCTDYFLFDTRGKDYGGNGIPFDWQLLQKYLSPKPYFLSGGLNLQNIKHLEKVRPQPFAIDVNSGFEASPGVKKVDELKLLIDQIRTENI